MQSGNDDWRVDAVFDVDQRVEWQNGISLGLQMAESGLVIFLRQHHATHRLQRRASRFYFLKAAGGLRLRFR